MPFCDGSHEKNGFKRNHARSKFTREAENRQAAVELAAAFRIVVVLPGHGGHDRVVAHYGVALVRVPVGYGDEFGTVDE